MAIGKVNTGGGGSGGTLVVTGVAGDTITATKDGKTYSRTFNSAGKAVFRGLATGTWALTMTNGSQTVTRNVTITADYSLTMAYFTATITVTYPANSTCTCSDGTTTLTDANTGTSEKTVTFTVPNTGNWVISCTDGTESTSKTISITVDGQTVTVELSYNLKLFDNGDQCENVTGGWVNGEYTYSNKLYSVTISDEKIQLYGKEGGFSGCGTENLIDLSKYSKLIIDINVISTNSTYSPGTIVLASSKTINTSNIKARYNFSTTKGRNQYEIDISGVDVSVYLCLFCGGATSYKTDIYAIYAEN